MFENTEAVVVTADFLKQLTEVSSEILGLEDNDSYDDNVDSDEEGEEEPTEIECYSLAHDDLPSQRLFKHMYNVTYATHYMLTHAAQLVSGKVFSKLAFWRSSDNSKLDELILQIRENSNKLIPPLFVSMDERIFSLAESYLKVIDVLESSIITLIETSAKIGGISVAIKFIPPDKRTKRDYSIEEIKNLFSIEADEVRDIFKAQIKRYEDRLAQVSPLELSPTHMNPVCSSMRLAP